MRREGRCCLGAEAHVEQPVGEGDVEKGAKAEAMAVDDDDGEVDAGSDSAVSAETINTTEFELLLMLGGAHPEGALHEVVGEVARGLHVADGEGEEPGEGGDGAREPLDVVMHLESRRVTDALHSAAAAKHLHGVAEEEYLGGG
jgi:hypothetical protein